MIVKDKQFKSFLSSTDLRSIVERVAAEVSADYQGKDLVVCPILTGAALFAADLVRGITVPCELHFVRYTSYSGLKSTGEVQCQLPFPASVAGRDVLIVEDVVDSGLTVQSLIRDAWLQHPRSVRVCALFYKPLAFKGNYTVNYIGREIGNEFIVGYGMDYDEQGRQLPEVMVIDE